MSDCSQKRNVLVSKSTCFHCAFFWHYPSKCRKKKTWYMPTLEADYLQEKKCSMCWALTQCLLIFQLNLDKTSPDSRVRGLHRLKEGSTIWPLIGEQKGKKNAEFTASHIVTADAKWVVFFFCDSHIWATHEWQHQAKITHCLHDNYNSYLSKLFLFFKHFDSRCHKRWVFVTYEYEKC